MGHKEWNKRSQRERFQDKRNVKSRFIDCIMGCKNCAARAQSFVKIEQLVINMKDTRKFKRNRHNW